MADPLAEELHALRERAYGPDADIVDDPVALTRLRELEDAARRGPGLRARESVIEPDTPEKEPSTDAGARPQGESEASDAAMDAAPSRLPAARSAATGAPSAATAALPAAVSAPHTPAAAAAADTRFAAAPPRSAGDTAPVVPWWRRHLTLVWAGSLVAALVIGVAATLSVLSVGAGRVAVLGVDPDADWSESFFGEEVDGARVFEPFHGVTVLATPQGFDGDDRMLCLYVMNDVPAGERSAMMTASCGTPEFPIVTSLVVTSSAPEELRERFAEGTALRFSLEDDRVSVDAARP